MTKTPAIDRAIRFLSDQIHEGTWKNNDRLPPLKVLSLKAHVSRNSMWRAAQELRKKGLLSFVKGGRIICGSAGELEAVATEKTPLTERWERTHNRIKSDLINGRFADSESLPTLQELQVQYGTSYGTLKKCLQSLERSGLIVPHKKSYRAARIVSRHSSQKILIVTDRLHTASFDVMAERNQELVKGIERECERTGLAVQFIFYEPENSAGNRRAIAAFGRDDFSIGCIVNLWWLGNETRKSQLNDIIYLLEALNKPVAIIDHMCDYPRKLSGNAFIIRPSNGAAGRAIIQALLRNGHRHFAFLSLSRHAVWSKERFKGMCKTVEDQAPKATVESFTSDTSFLETTFIPGLLNIDEQYFERIFRPSTPDSEYHSMLQAFRCQKKLNRKEGVFIKDLRPVADLIALKDMLNAPFSQHSFVEIRRKLLQEIENAFAVRFSNSIFQRALCRKDITAWICSNDDIANRAQNFLRSQDIKVPDHISIAGFDNKMLSFEESLTTYDFNFNAIIFRTIRFFLNPVQIPRTTEFEGLIIERKSTGMARTW